MALRDSFSISKVIEVLQLDSFSAGVSHVWKFSCPSSFQANTRRNPGFLLGRNSDLGYLRISERHISCLCDLWRSGYDRSMPECRIADREVDLGVYLQVDSEIVFVRTLEVRF